VLLVVVDALRADHLTAYGYDRLTDGALAELAAEGVCFEQAFASAPQLIPAHAALLTGCEPGLARRFLAPEFEGLNERRWFVPERLPRLAVEFLAAGYATAAFVDHELVSPSFGFGAGFQRFEFLDPDGAEDWEGSQNRRVVDHFLQWLGDLPSGRPWFAYVHLNDLERFWTEPLARGEGYFQPRPELAQVPPVANTDSVFFAVPRSHWRGGVRTLGQYEAAYDDEIRLIDQELGRLFATLRQKGRFDATSVHVVGSFGMQLGEAGMFLSSGRYSRADLGVPWIYRPAVGAAGAPGTRVASLVSTLDVAPTLLDLAGLGVSRRFHGRSQGPLLRSEADVPPREFVFASCGVQEGCAVIGTDHVLEYLFPLGTDDAQLRRSWTGTWSDLAMQPRLVFYDRARESRPPLEGDPEQTQSPRFVSYRTAALDWLRDMSDVRTYLQSPPGESGLDDLALHRLSSRGFIPPEAAPRPGPP